ncbi:MAG: rubredoxin [Deltaproteobacteria bacterium]|nr:rubredoxin [Deltaproteobacteria bacterium]
MKKWECTVCGYIHEGDEPPDECPVCGADRSKFIEMGAVEPTQTETEKMESETKEADLEPEESTPSLKHNRLFDLMVKHHLHPVSVHIPNGVLPVSVIFIFLAAIFNFSGLSHAAFYNLVFVVLAMPLVLFSGYIEWRKKYGGKLTTLFKTKMVCGAVVTFTAIILVVWLFVDPQVAASFRLSFLFINIVMLAAATTAGLLGGKLVFKD